MNLLARIYFIGAIAFAVIGHAYGQPSGKAATYAGNSPCSKGTRPLPGMNNTEGCDLMRWKLQLVNADENKPGTYILDCDYGLPRQGTKGFVNGKHLHREGKWIVINGIKTNPKAVIYRLDPDKPNESVSFIRLNDNVLHLLDSDMQLMIGDGGGGYTLNKVTR